jgi:predicted DNA-binding transcriptional regulator AlpA
MKKTNTPAAQSATVNPLGLLRLPQVLQLLPIGRSSFLAGVKEGRYPQPVKLGPATTCWRACDILNFIESLGAGHE